MTFKKKGYGENEGAMRGVGGGAASADTATESGAEGGVRSPRPRDQPVQRPRHGNNLGSIKSC